MLEKNDLNILQSVIARESELIEKYENYLQQIREPQLRSDVQSLLAQHRNQYNAMLGILEGGE